MKKNLIAIIALAVCAFSAYAQSETTSTGNDGDKVLTNTTYSKNVLTNDWKYNWELIGTLGTQFYYGDNDKYMGFFERFTPAFDLMLNKWASPSIGFAVGITGPRFKGVYQAYDDGTAVQTNPPHFMTDEVYKEHYSTSTSVVDGSPVTKNLNLYYQRGWYINPFVVAMFDLSNMIGGLKSDRFYTAQFYAGGGVMLGFDKDNMQLSSARGVSFNTGLINKFRINNRFDAVINLRGALVSDDFDGESREMDETYDAAHIKNNFPFDGIAGVTAGLCFHFGTKKDLNSWKKAESTTSDHYFAPVVLPAEKVYVEVHDTVEVGQQVDPSVWFHINFKIDKIDIQHRERININSIADFIKTTPDTKYLVCGYADMQTSYPAHNLWLSEHRAKNVYDMLVNTFGVNPDQLVIDYKGGVDYMFYKEEALSRCVMVIPLTGKNAEEYGERTITK